MNILNAPFLDVDCLISPEIAASFVSAFPLWDAVVIILLMKDYRIGARNIIFGSGKTKIEANSVMFTTNFIKDLTQTGWFTSYDLWFTIVRLLAILQHDKLIFIQHETHSYTSFLYQEEVCLCYIFLSSTHFSIPAILSVLSSYDCEMNGQPPP